MKRRPEEGKRGMSLLKKKIAIASFFILMIVLVFGFLAFKSDVPPNTMTQKEFEKLDDKEMEIIDTSLFLDERLEEWYFDKRKEKGEYVFHDGDHTYILVSLGHVKSENTFLMIHGVKEKNGKLILGYDALTLDDPPKIEFEDDIRSTLIRVKGKYNSVKTVNIIPDEQSDG